MRPTGPTLCATVPSCLSGILIGWLAASGPASAIELAGGRVNVDGFLETQVRSIDRDFELSDDWDLTQWWNVLDIEIEADLAPEGWGPFDVLSTFSRVEARYDCVWTRGCGVFSSANTYGDRAHNLPGRVSDGHRAGFRSTGTLFNGDQRRFSGLAREFLGFEFSRPPQGPVPGARRASRFFDVEGIDTLFDTAGPDQIFGNANDPAPFIFDEVLRDCLFAFRKIEGRENGVGYQVLGPWNPGCSASPTGRISGKPNPLRAGDLNPVVLGPGQGGFGALPRRPAPQVENDQQAPRYVARGIYLPNQSFAQMLRRDEFDDPEQNFSQAELAWNHGASQEQTKELKEAYLDMELLDSRLWIRAGKQTIVWGKTELFRNQDQFNPQDLALASLPSLEESRVALWALRGVWSFYDVGPLEDLRLELAANYDEFEPNDLGRCGEPYSPLPVCDKTYGLFIHGITGLGVAGEVRPPDPWSSFSGIEGGARLEFRWERFSFALTDFYGYADLPFQDPIFVYSRNVDPTTGRPRVGRAQGSCTTGSEPSCLTPENALEFHSVNQQVFAMICSTSVGLVPQLDPQACGQTVFNSQVNAVTGAPASDPAAEPTIAGLATNLVAGNRAAHILAQAGLSFGVPIPRVTLNVNAGDGVVPSNPFYSSGGRFPTFNSTTTVQQQALFGCGPLYSTDCEVDGIDLMNAEASMLLQSWPGFEGAGGSDWDTLDAGVLQPGTLGFEGGPVCTRFEGGALFILPGCRGPSYQTGTLIGGVVVQESDYQVDVDGDPSGLSQPFTGQPFRTELGAASFNTLMTLVALSSPPETFDSDGDGIPDTSTDQDGDGSPDSGFIAVDQFDPNQPFRTDGCSFAKPQLCSNVQSIFQITGLQRNTVRAGGGFRFGRRDFVWHGGSPLVLRYDKRNVLGFAMDWAEDVTKTNWGIEFTWVEGITFADFDEEDRQRTGQTYNLSVSIDRPTFINFLNANRTFFFNSQWFVQAVEGYRKSFPTNGPLNVLATFTVQTGFFRDRFQPNMTFVYDFRSNSGAWLPQVSYRYTENFSVTFGIALFAGRMQARDMPLVPTSLGNRAARHAYDDFVENGLSAVRERDEVFLRVRWTY